MDRPPVVTIAEKLALFNEHWSPKIIGELNDDKVQVVKLKGEFTWHSHDIEDELFLVLEGELLIHFRDKTETLKKGEMLIIPHGIEHKPEAIEEVHILLIEPKGTVNTGNSQDTSLTAEEATI